MSSKRALGDKECIELKSKKKSIGLDIKYVIRWLEMWEKTAAVVKIKTSIIHENMDKKKAIARSFTPLSAIKVSCSQFFNEKQGKSFKCLD